MLKTMPVTLQDVGKLIIRPHITIFLVMFFICGSIWGLIEAYFFWFLQVQPNWTFKNVDLLKAFDVFYVVI